MPEKKNSESKPVVIKAKPAVALAVGSPAKVIVSGSARSVSGGKGTLTVRGPGVTEVRQDVVTEYRASDGLSWAVIEARKDGQLIDFDLHNLTL